MSITDALVLAVNITTNYDLYVIGKYFRINMQYLAQTSSMQRIQDHFNGR